MQMISRQADRFIVLAAGLFLSQIGDATVVRMDLAIGNQPEDPVYIELYDSETPSTVANFLNYIETPGGQRRYDGTFVHRSISNFVVQGGGYAYDSGLGEFSAASAPHIGTDAPIVNEFDAGRSNVRGTIAMAKLGGDPNSATSEWFFNLTDNSANLDVQNGGFTVFGRVVGTGMDTIDAIAALPPPAIEDNLSATVFSQLPLYNHTPGSVIANDNLVTLTRVVQSPYSIPVFITPAPLDFGLVALSTPATRQITLTNLGNDNLVIGLVGDTDAVGAPFSIVADGCSQQTLGAFASCELEIGFSPDAIGSVHETFNIPSSDVGNPDVSVVVSGIGASLTPVLELSPDGAIDFGSVALLDTQDREVTVTNMGGGTLEVGPVEISGAAAVDFSIADAGNTCSSAQLTIGETCRFVVRLGANTIGTKSALLTVNASPNGQSVALVLTGEGVVSGAELVLPASPVNLGDTRVDAPITRTIALGNQGIEDLIISSTTITGSNAGEFSVSEACTRVAPSNGSCQISVTFTPNGTGAKSAVIQLLSNDPQMPSAILEIVATASEDDDGVPDSVELAAPNQGDGNLDGVLDHMQAHVTSLTDINGRYVTIDAEAGTRLGGVAITGNPSPDNSPVAGNAAVAFPNGFISFIIRDVQVGGSTSVSIYLPSDGTAPNDYFKYGWAPGDIPNFSPQRWYPFSYNGVTGAEYFPDRVVLHFVDGGRGDSDLSANGIILDPGAPAIIDLSSGGGSSGGGCTLKRGAPHAFDYGLLLLVLVGLHVLRRRTVLQR
jgi:cyclophilin family peptidyl-prolyl cis-trans isomerase